VKQGVVHQKRKKNEENTGFAKVHAGVIFFAK